MYTAAAQYAIVWAEAIMAVAVLKKERIGFTANSEQKSLLKSAARLKNLPLSSYILSCSLRQAQIDLAENETLLLFVRDRDTIMSALESPPAPNAALKELFK